MRNVIPSDQSGRRNWRWANEASMAAYQTRVRESINAGKAYLAILDKESAS